MTTVKNGLLAPLQRRLLLGARNGALPYVLMLAFAAVPPVVLELINLFGDHSVPAGQCEGIGWGCVLSASDTAKLLLLFVIPVCVVWAAGSLVVLALLRRRPSYRARPAVVQALIPVAPTFLLLLLYLFL